MWVNWDDRNYQVPRGAKSSLEPRRMFRAVGYSRKKILATLSDDEQLWGDKFRCRLENVKGKCVRLGSLNIQIIIDPMERDAIDRSVNDETSAFALSQWNEIPTQWSCLFVHVWMFVSDAKVFESFGHSSKHTWKSDGDQPSVLQHQRIGSDLTTCLRVIMPF